MGSQASQSTARFAGFELDLRTGELRKNGRCVRLQAQPLKALLVLLEHPGELVTREQLRKEVWPQDTFVDFDHGLNKAIAKLRDAVDESEESPSIIETLPRLGYRFIASVERVDESKTASGQPSLPSRLRIVLLPIRYLEGDAEDYFSVGLTEDMISALARLDSERLRVVMGPRLQPQEIDEACLDRLQRELALDYLLRISVRRSVETIRISAQLHDLKDKSVLWSETYDRKASDLLEVQGEVASRVSQSLAGELLPRSEGMPKKYARSAAAYDAYLKGRYFWHRMTSEGMRSSMAHFSEAIAIDASLAPAYAGLADCYAQMGSIRVATMKPLDALAKAKPLLQRALELDDTLVEAHCTLALLKIWYELDWRGADQQFLLALSLDPNNVTTLLWRSLYLSAAGRHEESIVSVQRALECDPLSPVVNTYLGVAREHAGQYDLAIRQLNQAIELDPHYYRPYLFLGRTLCDLDRHADAIAAFQKALSINPENLEAVAYIGSAMASAGNRSGALESLMKVKESENRFEPAILLAIIYARLGETAEMFQWLRIAFERKSTPLYLVVLDKGFRRYESDPRFRSFLALLGLPTPPTG